MKPYIITHIMTFLTFMNVMGTGNNKINRYEHFGINTGVGQDLPAE